MNVLLDGNKANNTSGYGVKIYGKGYIIDYLTIIDCPEVGFYSEAGVVVGQHDWRDMPETHITLLRVRNCGGDNIVFRGPHDAVFDKIISVNAGGVGFKNEYLKDVYGGLCHVKYAHVYGSAGDGIELGASFIGGIIISESNDGRGLYHKTGTCFIEQLSVYSSATYGIYSESDKLRIDRAYIYNCSVAAIKLLEKWHKIKAYIKNNTVSEDLVQIEHNNNELELHIHDNSLSGNIIRLGTATTSISNCKIKAIIVQAEGTVFKLYSAGRNIIEINGWIDTATANHWDGTKHSTDIVIYKVAGKGSLNSGIATFSGDGSTTQFKIEHGLVKAPSKVQVTPMSADAAGDFYVTADDTYIYINYSTAPPSGTDNVKVSWCAEV